MAVMLTLSRGRLDPLANKLALALLYAVGFVFVNVGRSELFTEHTTLMMYPMLGGPAVASDSSFACGAWFWGAI